MACGPACQADGVTVERTSGCAQGGPLSPLLANIFGHYVFDRWMARKYSAVTFERYSDDVVVHCVSERQARAVLADIRRRLGECGLELNEAKTRIVYCADDGRKQPWDGPTGYDFLGYTCRGRTVQWRRDGRLFVSFGTRSYYPVLDATVGRLYALYVHGGSDICLSVASGPSRSRCATRSSHSRSIVARAFFAGSCRPGLAICSRRAVSITSIALSQAVYAAARRRSAAGLGLLAAASWVVARSSCAR